MKKLFYLIPILFFGFVVNVSAAADYNLSFNLSIYDNISENFLETINNYIYDTLDSTYRSSSGNVVLLCGNFYNFDGPRIIKCFSVGFSSRVYDSTTNGKLDVKYVSSGNSVDNVKPFIFRLDFENETITTTTSSFMYKPIYYIDFYPLVIYKHNFTDLYYSDVYDSSLSYWYSFNSPNPSRYNNYVVSNGYGYSTDRFYSVYELVTGNGVDLSAIPQDYTYYIQYYFNDILDTSFTQELVYNGFENDVVPINVDSSINGYDLDTTNTYQYVVGSDNIVKVYYYNEMYNKQYYTIEVYLDDIYSSRYSYTNYGVIGGIVVLDLPSTINNFYDIDDNLEDFTIDSDVTLNTFKVNYYSDIYGTEYQFIDFTDSRFYLFFDYDDLIDVFPNIKFTHFTQFQQLIIVLGVNLLFVVFLLFVCFIVIRLIQKIFSYLF